MEVTTHQCPVRRWAVNLCCSSRVSIFLLSASLISALLVQPDNLCKQSCLGRFAVLISSFHFQKPDWTKLCEIFKNLGYCFITTFCFKLLHIFIYFLSAEFLGFNIAVYLVMFSKKPLRSSQSCWISDVD